MEYLRLAAAQLNTVVGDLAGNVDRVLGALAAAEAAGADICVVPELAIPGYPPEDLLLKPGFVADNVAALEKVAAATGPLRRRGRLRRARRPTGRGLANAAAVCAGGRVVGIYRKQFLPNYGVFDEQRWFVPSDETSPTLFEVAGAWVGVSVCEDVWFPDGPVAQQGRAGADVVVNLNASPYNRGRRTRAPGHAAASGWPRPAAPSPTSTRSAARTSWSSTATRWSWGPTATLLATGAQFAPDLVVVDIPFDPARRTGRHRLTAAPGGGHRARPGAAPPPLPPAAGAPDPLPDHAEVYAALVLGTRDYLGKNGFTEAVIGLSGGIDSSLVATVAVDALGPDARARHLHAVALFERRVAPRRRGAGRAPGHRPARGAHRGGPRGLHRHAGRRARARAVGLTDENLQSRLRGVLLMGVSNAKGWIVLTTGNKSEMATGYSTLYGDSAGGFAVIKDVPKTLVYDLCRYRNTEAVLEGLPGPIPDSVLDKPPSAELRPDQRDDQSLPPYEELDPVLQGYVEGDRTAADLVADGFDPAVVEQVVRLVDGAEYKRRQMPPGVRITTKAFGKDRRMPITNRYRSARRAATVRRPTELTLAHARSGPSASWPSGVGALLLGGAPALRSSAGSRPGRRRRRATWRSEVPVVLGQMSARATAASAQQWHDRLPVRAGVEPAALIVPPPGRWPRCSTCSSAEPDLTARLAGLSQVVLPRLLEHLRPSTWRAASPVSEAPVWPCSSGPVAGPAARSSVRSFWECSWRAIRAPNGPRRRSNSRAALERPFGSATGVFPGARAS